MIYVHDNIRDKQDPDMHAKALEKKKGKKNPQNTWETNNLKQPHCANPQGKKRSQAEAAVLLWRPVYVFWFATITLGKCTT